MEITAPQSEMTKKIRAKIAYYRENQSEFKALMEYKMVRHRLLVEKINKTRTAENKI